MEELFKQLKASGHVPESWSFDDFNYMYSDKDRRSKMFSKMGFEADDTSVTYNPYNNMVVDFNRGTVYQGGIKEVRNKVEEKPRTGGDLNRLNYFPKPSGKTQKELADEKLKNEEAYVSYTKAVTKNGVKDYIRQSKDLETKVEKLGGGAVAAYELFDEFYKTAQGDIAKSTDILVKRLREKYNDFEDFYKNFSKFDSLSEEQKFEVASNPIMKDQDFKDIIEIREGYNVLESQKYQAKQELKQYDPQRYNDLATIEDIQSNRDELTKTPLSKVTNTAGRLLGRTLQGVSAVIPFDKQSANIYRAGQDLIDIFPTSSKSEGQALAYQKEFTYGDKTYYAVYDTEDAVEPSSVRDESGYVVKDPAINKRALQAEGDKQKYFNPNSFATQTVDVLLDVGVDALTGKGIAKAFSTVSKPSKLAYAIGTSIPGYARSYASAYNEYIKNPDIDTDDAQIAAVARGLAEGVIINRLNPLESELAESGMRRFTAEYTKKNIGKIASGEIGAREIAGAFLRGAGKMGLGGVKETGEEELEEQFSSNVVNPILNYRNGTDFKEGVTADEIANIALISLASGVLGDAGAINVSKSKLVNSALKSISENQDIYNAWLRGVRESDPELASRIDEEISPIVKEASVYGNVKDKEKLIEKLIEARKLEKEIQSISVPDLKDKKKEQLAVVHSSIVDLVNAPVGDADTQVAAEEEIAPDGDSAPGVATELGNGEGDVNPSPFNIDTFIGETSAAAQVDITLGEIKTKIDNGEDVSTAQLEPVRNSLYSLYDQIDQDNTRSPEQKESMKTFVLNEIEKLEGYEFETKNETSPVTKTRTIKGSTPIGTKDAELSSKYYPTADRFDGQTGTIVKEDGSSTEATFFTDENGGLYISEREDTSFYTNSRGEKTNVVFTDQGPKPLKKNGEVSKVPVPKNKLEEVSKNRKNKGTPQQISAEARFVEPIINENGETVGAVLEDRGNRFTVNNSDLALDLAILQKIEDIGAVPEAIFEETILQYQETPTPEYVRNNAQEPQETQTVPQEAQALQETNQTATGQATSKTDLEAKKADIERRRQEVERLSNKELTSPTGKINTGKIEIPILPSQNIDKTIYKDNKGVEYKVKANFKNLQDVLLGRNGKYLFRGMQGRFFVLAKVGDFYLPFYISSAGTSGKKQGEWYPFFGYTGNWLVKGRVGNKGEMEYSQKISEVQKLLQENLQFPSRFLNLKGEMKVGDNVIYDINQDFNYIEHFTTFGDGTVKREGDKYPILKETLWIQEITGFDPRNVDNDGKGSADAWINDVIALTENAPLASKGKINAKYDAELKALEQQPTTSKQSDLEAKKANIERRRQEDPSVERGVLINFESGKTKEQLIDIVNKLRNGKITFDEIVKEFFNLPTNTLSEVKEAFNDGTLADKIQFGLDVKELSDLQPKTRSREEIIKQKQKSLSEKQKAETALKDSEYKIVKKKDPITGRVTESKVKRTPEEKSKYEDFHKKALEDANKKIKEYDAELDSLNQTSQVQPNITTNEQVQSEQGPGTDGGTVTPQLPTIEVSSPTAGAPRPTQPSNVGATPEARGVQDVLQETGVPTEVQPTGGDVQVSAQDRKAELESRKAKLTELQAEYNNPETTEERKAQIKQEALSLRNIKYQAEGESDNFFEDIFGEIDAQINQLDSEIKKEIKDALEQVETSSDKRTAQFEKFFKVGDDTMSKEHAKLANRLLERVASRLGNRSKKLSREWIAQRLKWIGKASAEQLKGTSAKFQKLYHGSKSYFNKFSSDKIGTGVGAARGGWGIYLAVEKERSKAYADMLTKPVLSFSDTQLKEGDLYYRQIKDSFDKNPNSTLGVVKDLLRKSKNLYNTYLEEKNNLKLAGEVDEYGDPIDTTYTNSILFEAQDLKAYAKQILKTGIAETKAPTYLYAVSVSDDLNWLNFNEVVPDNQYNQILEQAQKEDSPYLEAIKKNKNKQGRDFYWNVASSVSSSEKALSQLLLRSGIDGNIVFEDATREYVVFDSDKLSIEDSIKFQVEQTNEMLEATNRVADNMLTALDEMINERLTTIRPGISVEESQRQVEGLRKIKAELEAKRAKVKWQEDVVYRAAALEVARNEFAILALDSPNASSLIHEFAHIFEPDMTSEEKDLFIKQYNKAFETNETDWSTDVSEYFARTLEKYLSNGRKLTSKEISDKKTRDGIQEIFDKFTEWLKGVYEGIISYTNSKGVTREVVINDEIQAFFDKLLVDEIPEIDVPINGGRFLERHLSVSDLNKLERFQRNPSVADDDIREIALEMTADVKDEDLESYANDLELDYNNEIRKTGWQFLALGHLATKAEQLGDFELQDKIVGRMDRILSGAGRALRLGRTDLMKEFTGLRLQKLLEVKFNKAMTQQDANGFTAQDASRRVVENDAMPSPEEIMNDLKEPSETEVDEKVVVQQPSDKEKAKSFLEAARKRLKNIIGQANSGINPEMVLVAVDLLKAAYYETKHSYKSIKSKFRKYAKDLGIEDGLINNLYQKALESAPEIRNEIVFNDINEKIANIGKGSKIPSADPMQAVINNIYRIYTTKYKTPLEAKEKFKRDFEARQVKISDIENAISAVNYGMFSSDPVKSAEIKARLEDLLSWHQDKVVGASAIRAKLNTVNARDAIKKILEKRLSPNDKSRFIDDIATTLVGEYGFTADEATKYAAEVRNSVERALNQKVQGSERTRAEKIFLDGIGLNKDLLEQALKETTDKINNPKTSEAERKLMKDRAKRLQTKLDNLESNIEKSLTSGKQTIGKLLDAIASGMTDRVGIAAALKDQFGIKEAGLRPYLDQVNSIAQRLRAAEAINDPRAIKKAEAELGDVLKEIARNADYKGMSYVVNFTMNQLLSGFNTGAIALISGVSSVILQAAIFEVSNLIRRIVNKPKVAAAYFEAMTYVVQNTVDYMRYEGWPKIVQIWKGTNLNTDLTREDIQKMQFNVSYYQAKLEQNLLKKMPKRFDKAAVLSLSKLANFAFLSTQMYMSKGLAIFDVVNKAMVLPWRAASERFSLLEKDPVIGKKASDILKAFKEIYVEKRKNLIEDYVSQGYDLEDAKVMAAEVIAHEELKDLDANTVDAVRDFSDMATLTGESTGNFTSLAVRLNQKIASLGPTAELLIKAPTTYFLPIAGRLVDITKFFSLASSFGPPVETTIENGMETHKVNWNQSWKTPIKFISSNLYYKTWYTKDGWQVRPLKESERVFKVGAMTTVLAMTALPFYLFKLGDCKFSPNSPTGCLEPRFPDFRITGKGRDWDQIDGYKPYAIQTRGDDGIWETHFEFVNIPPMVALLAPIGYITDKYYQSRLANATEKPLSSLAIGAAGAPFINMWDNSIVQIITPLTQLLNYVSSTDESGKRSPDWGKTFAKTGARLVSPYITPGGNLVNTSTNLLDDATDSQPQVAKDIKSNWFNQTVSDRLADNMIYRWAFGSAPETSAIGLPVIADFDSALLPSGLEGEDIDKIDYLTSEEKRIYKTMKRFEDDGAIFRAYPRQSFNKEGEGATVEVINGLISFEEMYSGSRRIEKLFGDYLRTHIGRIERMSSKDFEGVRRMQSTFKQKVEGDLLYFKLLELGVPGILAPEEYETDSKDEYGEPLTYINPTKIVDWLKENQIQIRGNKIITGFKYSDLLYEKPDRPLFK